MSSENGAIAVLDQPQSAALAPMSASSVDMLIAKAIEHSVPVETMERLMSMRRELKAEAAKEAFVAAMSKFQQACPVIHKTKSVKTKEGRHAYSYAPLESVVAQVQGLLAECGFSYRHEMELLQHGVKVTCHVTQTNGGHTESTSMEVPFGTKTQVMSDSQVVAAANTFAKRYSFLQAFGIMTADEDNDGAAVHVAPPNSQPRPAQQQVAERTDQYKADAKEGEQWQHIHTHIEQVTHFAKATELELKYAVIHVYPPIDPDKVYPGDMLDCRAWITGQQHRTTGKPLYAIDPARWPITTFAVHDVAPPSTGGSNAAR